MKMVYDEVCPMCRMGLFHGEEEHCFYGGSVILDCEVRPNGEEQADYQRYLAEQDANKYYSAAEGMAEQLDKSYQREAELQENLDEANGVIQQLITAFNSAKLRKNQCRIRARS